MRGRREKGKRGRERRKRKEGGKKEWRDGAKTQSTEDTWRWKERQRQREMHS